MLLVDCNKQSELELCFLAHSLITAVLTTFTGFTLREKLLTAFVVRLRKECKYLIATSESIHSLVVNVYLKSLFRASFVKQPKAERQAKLLKEYGFICDCEACTNNFPSPPALTYKDAKLFKFAAKSSDEILQLQMNQAIKRYRECCKLVQNNHQSFPCMEICLLQKCIVTFLLRQTQPAVLFS